MRKVFVYLACVATCFAVVLLADAAIHTAAAVGVDVSGQSGLPCSGSCGNSVTGAAGSKLSSTGADNLLNQTANLISGHIGTLIGFLMSLVGFWIWLGQQNSFGLVMVLLGAAIPSIPGLYSGFIKSLPEFFSEIKGSDSSASSFIP